ncbi:MAG: hypothetical protein QE271_11760 [Bacteriovoracaceae bacterium]|nr:hypothetical protein [Bacteriovoracaceae bacterium]
MKSHLNFFYFFFLIACFSCGRSDQTKNNTNGFFQLNTGFPFKAVLLERTQNYSVGQVNLLAASADLNQLDYQLNFLKTTSDITVSCDANQLYFMERYNKDSLAKFNWQGNSIAKIPQWQISTFNEQEDGSGPDGEGLTSANPSQVLKISSKYSVLLRYDSRFFWILDNEATQGSSVRAGRVDLRSLYPKINPNRIADSDQVPEISGGIQVGKILYLVFSHLDRNQAPWAVNLPATLIGLDTTSQFQLVFAQTLPIKNVSAKIQKVGKYLYIAGVDLMMTGDPDHPEVANNATNAGLVRFNLDTNELKTLIDQQKISSFAVVGDFVVYRQYAYFDKNHLKVYSLSQNTIWDFDPSVDADKVEVLSAGPGNSLWLGVNSETPSWLIYKIDDTNPSQFSLYKSLVSELIPMGLEFCI